MMPCLLTTSLASWVKRPWLGVEVACKRHKHKNKNKNRIKNQNS